jgi:putative Mn2+ efflux pump MntP
MKKDKKIALIIMFIVGLILIMVAIEYDNNTTAEKIRNEREKIEARLEAVKAKDSIENKKD